MKRSLTLSFLSAAFALPAILVAQEIVPGKGLPAIVRMPPAVTVGDLRQDEKPVDVKFAEETLETNGLYSRVKASFVFTNPNLRQMSADFEFPLPEGASVCGYSLQIGDDMIPGVVTGKEKARVAFESEKAKRIDPGIVEHVKGNIWKTRIFPLLPNVPRKAEVEYIVPVEGKSGEMVCERDGEDVFVGIRAQAAAKNETIAEKIAAFASGAIFWDASTSARKEASNWLSKLALLPEKGDWVLVFLRNAPEGFKRFSSREELLAAVKGVDYDGGTRLDIKSVLPRLAEKFAGIADPADVQKGTKILLFTDEIDTLNLETPDYESIPDLCIASRDDAAPRKIEVRKLAKGEEPPKGLEAKESTLLATAWAADRIKDLSSQSERREEEFLMLGRKYGVASPVTSLIVLENLQQYIEHDIEPSEKLSFHDEWVELRKAKDDAISRKEAQSQHETALLKLWKERIEWWNNPIPPRPKRKSGLFDGVFSGSRSRNQLAVAGEAMAGNTRSAEAPASSRRGEESVVARTSAVRFSSDSAAEMAVAAEAPVGAAEISPRRDSSEAGTGGATISLKEWNPSAPYLDAMDKAEDPYREYLVQKEANGSSPAFFMDAAGWFFKKGDKELAKRILSNMAEFKLENAAVWRSMGWKLREKLCLEEAVLCFRQALRLRNEEGQARRDLALVLSELGKAKRDVAALEEAMRLFKDAAFTNRARRSGRRSNDLQVSIIALEELNALISWCNASNIKANAPDFDEAYRRDIPLKIRIVLSWDADETDVDIHVLEPDGNEAYYSNRRTETGGFVSEDVTTGYGPEEYLRKEGKGAFKVLAHYYASHQTDLTGPATASATVYTDWGTAKEKMQILTLRLDKPREKTAIGEITVD